MTKYGPRRSWTKDTKPDGLELESLPPPLNCEMSTTHDDLLPESKIALLSLLVLPVYLDNGTLLQPVEGGRILVKSACH